MILRMRNKHWEHTRFYVLLSLLTVLIFSRYGLQIGIPRIILTAIIALTALLGDRNEILAIAMCCIPLHEAVDFSYALVSCAGIYILKYHGEIRINLAVILTLIIIFWELLHCFETDFSLMSFLFSMVPLIFLAVILCVDISKIDYAFVVRTMATVAVSTCVVLLVNLIVQASFNLAAAFAGLQRLGLASENSKSDAMVGGTINPNSLGIICVLAITGLFQLRAIGQNKKMDIFATVTLLIFGAMTVSRTFLACLLAMAVLLLISYSEDIQKKMRFIFAIILFIIAALLVLNWFFPDLLEYYVQRFQVDDISGGRSKLNKIYSRYILDNPDVLLLGVGRSNFTEKLTETYRVAILTPHNVIQEIIVAWGIPGLLLFAMLFGILIIHSRKFNKGHTLLNYIPLLIIILKSMVGQLLTSHYTVLALSYAYLSLCQDFQLKKEER